MLVHVGVLLAFDGAIGADLAAGFEHALDQRFMAAGRAHIPLLAYNMKRVKAVLGTKPLLEAIRA